MDFTSNLENLESLTSKSLVSTSGENRASLLTDVWWQSNFAQQNLAQLPFEGGAVQKTTKFLTQLGDYSYALAKKSAKDLPISNSEINNLQDLHNRIGVFGEELRRLNEKNGRDPNSFEEFKNISNKTKVASENLTYNTFKRIDKQMQQYPTLVYDGPFADRLQQKNPQGLKGSIITSNEAKKKALSIAQEKKSERYTAVNIGFAKGKIPAYTLRLDAVNKSESIYLDISRQGGSLVWMLNPKKINNRFISTIQARVYAENFLMRNGYEAMKASYSFRQGNTTVFTFVYSVGGIIVYPDLIKVKVSLDNGQIVGFEGVNYIMNHRKRNLPVPEYGKEKARSRIPSNLKIASERLAVIPSDTGKEILCYEYRVKLRGETFLIYINALNGDEEQILKIIEAPNGEWAM